MRALIAGALVLVALADVARGCGMSVHNEVCVVVLADKLFNAQWTGGQAGVALV